MMQITSRAAMAAIIPIFALMPFLIPARAAAQEATPTMTYSCETAMTASPIAGMEGMAMGTPAAGEHDMTDENAEFDQLYIDMMVPHHASIIALAQAAQDQLTDERLAAIAANIIGSQQAEIEELQSYREEWYGSPDGMPIDEGMMTMMTMMMERMPGMGDMDEMAMLMDAQALVATFCAAKDPDLAFIDLTIPHHQMAIDASLVAYMQAVHPEIKDIANEVIEAQEREIEELTAIRAELTGAATPAAS